MKGIDFICSQLLFPASAFLGSDVFLVAHEISDSRLSSKREIHAKELARTHPRKGQRGFAQGFARDRTGVDPGAANFVKFLDKRDALAKNSSGVSDTKPCRPAADYDQIKCLNSNATG